MSSRGGPAGSVRGALADAAAATVTAAVALVVFGGVLLVAGLATAVTTAVLGAAAVLVLRRPVDGVTAVVAIVVVLLLWPSGQRISGLGAAGAPVVVLGSLAACWWGVSVLRRDGWVCQVPVRLYAVLGAFVASLLLSYVAANVRPDLVLVELDAADRGAVTFLSCVAVALLVAGVLSTDDRLHVVVRALVISGAGAALLGVVTFFTGWDPVADLTLPGFTPLVSDWDNNRSGFARMSATTAHPIEYSVVMAMVLPFAIHLALRSQGRARGLWWTAVVLIAAVLPMTVSRTAVLGLAAVGMVLLPSWSPRRRVQMLLAAAVGVVCMRLLVPGLVGTIRSLFTSAGEDPSVSARTDDYDYAFGFLVEHPVLGRGYSTFVPGRYTFLDNEFLMTAVTGGVLGLVVLLLLFAVPFGMAYKVAVGGVQPERRDLAFAVMASLLAFIVTAATYDAMSFSTARGLFFVCVGLAGALWAVQEGRAGSERAAGRSLQGRSSRSTHERLVPHLEAEQGPDAHLLVGPAALVPVEDVADRNGVERGADERRGPRQPIPGHVSQA